MKTAVGRFQFPVRGNFIEGKFSRASDPQGQWVSRSPANFQDELGRFDYSYASVDEAVLSARKAFRSWKKTGLTERQALIKSYQQALIRRKDEIAEIIAREVGKPLWESRTEVDAMINKVDITINESLKLVLDFEIPEIQERTRGACRYRPLGVMAVIGPFNFPGHLPNGHFIPALLTGNTVIFKPSEKAPLVGQLIAECFEEAGLPAGVFSLIQGEKEVGRRLCVHDEVDGILFTGSYEVGLRIKQDTLQQHWKLLALEMGGKNSILVWEDADLEVAVYETLFSAFATAGQRCSGASRVVIHPGLCDEFTRRLHERAKAFKIGHPLEDPFMGPLIDQSSVDRYMKFLGIATREGCEIIMRGKALELGVQGFYVSPTLCRVKSPSLEQTLKSVYQQTELFAPNLVILPVADLDEAIAQINATQYGLVASVFSRSRQTYLKCIDELEMGAVNWNKGTVGASSRLPFGGVKKSGNHFPTALSAPLYCTTPVSSLETSETKLPEKLAPGVM